MSTFQALSHSRHASPVYVSTASMRREQKGANQDVQGQNDGCSCYAKPIVNVNHLEEVLGSSASVVPTDASSMLSRSGESEMRRNCRHIHSSEWHMLARRQHQAGR